MDYIIVDDDDAPSSCVKALNQLLDLPHLYVLLSRVLTHFGAVVLSPEGIYSRRKVHKTQREEENGDRDEAVQNF